MSIRARKRVNTVVSKAGAYDTILRPIITEKATMANEVGQVTFAVAMNIYNHLFQEDFQVVLMS